MRDCTGGQGQPSGTIKTQLLRGFKTAEERQVAKHWLYSQEAYVLGRQAPHGKGKFIRGKTKSGPDVVKALKGGFTGQARVGLTKYRQTGYLNF